MPVFDDLSVREALEVALVAADHLSEKHAGTVAAARVAADRLDVLRDFSFVDPDTGKFDNVTLGAFLKFMAALGLVAPPVEVPKGGAQGASQKSELDMWRERQQEAV